MRVVDFSGIVPGMSAVISVLLHSASEKVNGNIEKAHARIEFQGRPVVEVLGVDLLHIER